MNKTQEKYIRKVFCISKLALVLAFCFVVLRTVIIPQRTGEIFAPTSAGGSENVRPIDVTKPLDTSVGDYSAIVEQNIFGGAALSSRTNRSLLVNRTPSLMRSAEQELGLALVGTVAGSPAVSRAIIKDLETSVLSVYRTGETVAAANIQSIEPDVVILLHQGQEKVLNLHTNAPEQREAHDTQAPSSRNTRRAVDPAKTRSPDKSHASKGAVPGGTETILTEAVIEPYAVHGQVEGLKITGIENVQRARNLGLKNGDVIRSVNGQRLTSKQKAFQVLKKARSQPNMSVELLRNDEHRTLSFSLK